MTENQFWQLIEDARATGDTVEGLSAALVALPLPDIVSFEDVLSKKIADAATFPILAACFVIMSYVSDDTFDDFRAWLVSQGRTRYSEAVKDPETIADWLRKDEVDEIDGESILMLPYESYKVHGREEDFDDQAAFIADPKIEVAWPDTKDEFRERFPKLVGKFWNQKRINELHSD